MQHDAAAVLFEPTARKIHDRVIHLTNERDQFGTRRKAGPRLLKAVVTRDGVAARCCLSNYPEIFDSLIARMAAKKSSSAPSWTPHAVGFSRNPLA
jgi:hypothetical protein